MKRLNFISILLALSLILTAIPIMAQEPQLVESQIIEDLEEAKEETTQILNETEDPQIKDLSEEAIEVIDELEDKIIAQEYTQEIGNRALIPGLQSIGEHYGIDTIKPRVELAIRTIDLINYVTNNLTDRVAEAHNKAAMELSIAFAVVIDPMATKNEILAKIDYIYNLKDELIAYPVLGPEDTATIYIKAELNDLIWQVRFQRDKEVLGKVPFPVYHELNGNITKAVGVWFNPKATVQEVYDAMDNLQSALDFALSQK